MLCIFEVKIEFYVFLGVHNYASNHLKEAIDFITQTADKYPYDRLVSENFSLRDLPDAVQVATNRKYYRVAIVP